MKIRTLLRFFVCSMLTVPITAEAQSFGDKVASGLGKSGTMMPGDVYRVGLPRTDLTVSLDGVTIRPTFALGGWLAFKAMGPEAMVMGDLVLTEAEVNPVMAKLFAEGLSVTAVHNHLLRTQPATFYMHVSGHGDPEKLAGSLCAALAESKVPMTAPAASTPPTIDLDVAKINEVLGAKGNPNGGVLSFGIPLAYPITDDGMVVPPAMGTAIAINFQPAGNGQAAITGDLVMLASEVNPVLASLREHGIEVTAVHNHMLDDQPHTYYAHFWAVDDAVKLAGGLRAALDKLKLAKG